MVRVVVSHFVTLPSFSPAAAPSGATATAAIASVMSVFFMTKASYRNGLQSRCQRVAWMRASWLTPGMPTFNFALRDLPPEAESLRTEVRAFLDEQFGGANPVKRARSWGGFDREFSRRVGARGWIGMTWPKQYGGGERTFLERYVVMEEMLAAGAPVSAHWVADRQSGPLLLRFGTEEQRQRILPGIVRAE